MGPIMASLQSCRVVDGGLSVELNRQTWSSAETGSLGDSEQQFTLMLFFITAPLKLS